MALTVAELAEVIRRPDADRAAVVERLRAWSDVGLLQPAASAIRAPAGRACMTMP